MSRRTDEFGMPPDLEMISWVEREVIVRFPDEPIPHGQLLVRIAKLCFDLLDKAQEPAQCTDHSCASCQDCEDYMNDLADGREHVCSRKIDADKTKCPCFSCANDKDEPCCYVGED